MNYPLFCSQLAALFVFTLTAAFSKADEKNTSLAASPVPPPNVLFIAVDDLNDWTGMLKGNPQARTPHMDSLASKGMVFTNAHCAAPACGPSRSAIMSGIRPSTSGNYINKSSLIHNPILNNSVLLPEFFQRNGYYVCGVGKLFHGYHFNNDVKGRGFDEYYPSKTQDLPPWQKPCPQDTARQVLGEQHRTPSAQATARRRGFHFARRLGHSNILKTTEVSKQETSALAPAAVCSRSQRA